MFNMSSNTKRVNWTWSHDRGVPVSITQWCALFEQQKCVRVRLESFEKCVHICVWCYSSHMPSAVREDCHTLEGR